MRRVRVRVHLADVVRELPRRAHDLSRREVEESQRWRILEAVTEVTAKHGYADATVTDIIGAAGLSRKTFYEQFKDKEDCFLTAYDVLSTRLLRAMAKAAAPLKQGPARRRAQLETFLVALDRAPAVGRVFMLDVLGAGARALKRRHRLDRLFADAVLGDAVDDEVLRTAIIGGVNNVVVHALGANDPKSLVDLLAPLASFIERGVGQTRARDEK